MLPVQWGRRIPYQDTLLCFALQHGVSINVSDRLLYITDYLFILVVIGHLRPLCAFASKVVSERPDVVITFMAVGGFYQQVEREIGRYFSASEAESGAKRNIR